LFALCFNQRWEAKRKEEGSEGKKKGSFIGPEVALFT
jgi:hypothetical protein